MKKDQELASIGDEPKLINLTAVFLSRKESSEEPIVIFSTNGFWNFHGCTTVRMKTECFAFIVSNALKMA